MRSESMEASYKAVMVYIDEEENLIAIPIGISDKYGLAGLNLLFGLRAPYNDKQIEFLLSCSMDKCYSEKADDTAKESVLEKFLNVKGFENAVKKRRLVNYEWVEDSGYKIIPTNKKPQQGFVHLENETIRLGKEIKNGELAKAFRAAIQLSSI
jgi:hypothetical protein